MTDTIRALCVQVANACALPQDLFCAQVEHESAGDPCACRYEQHFFDSLIRHNPSASAAKYGPVAALSLGLLQIMVETAYEQGFDGQPWELASADVPRIGLMQGAKRMQTLLSLSGNDYPAALAAYNGGSALLKLPRQRWPTSVQQYVSTVYALAGKDVEGASV